MIYGIIVIMIPALASIFDFCLSDNWPVHVCRHGLPPAPATHSTLESADAPLFLPQEEQVQRQAGARPCTGLSLQLCMGTISLNLVYKILTSTCTCTHLPLRLTNPLRVRKLHFPPLGEAGTRAGWYTIHMLVQINSGVRYLWVFFIQIENYAEHWPLHVRAPTCPHAQPSLRAEESRHVLWVPENS